ncbi:MAG: FIST N-terminal domain-containing protein [Phycisphaerales bacterium]
MPSTKPEARIACGLSEREDTESAIAEIVESVAPQMRGTTDLAVVMFSPHHREHANEIASALLDSLAPGALLGLSAAGVVSNEHEVEKRPGISLFAASLPGAKISAFTEADLNWPEHENDEAALRESIGAHVDDLRAVILLADPFTPLARLVPALSKSLDRSLDAPPAPLIGGVASAGQTAGENRYIFNDTVRTGGILGVTISGSVRVDTVVSQGCRPIGKPFVVTKSRHNIIETLGGRPSLQAFQEMVVELDDEDRDLLRKGLFVGFVVNEYQDRFGRGDFLIRNVVGVDDKKGVLAVSDIARVGQTVQFHVRDAASALEDLEMLLAAQQLDEPPLGGLLFTCNGRGSNLFEDDGPNDAKTIRSMLNDIPLAGFFAAGEIGPVGPVSYIHGFTASLALFRV